MKKIWPILLCLSFSLFAAEDYQLVQFENQHYQDYTFEELTSQFQETKILLPAYVCNGKNEKDFFWSPLLTNPKKDSLRVKLHKSEEILIYREGYFLNLDGSPADSRSLNNLFVRHVIEAFEKLEDVPEAAKLLRFLESSYFTLTVTFGGNTFNPKVPGGGSYRGLFMAGALSILNHGRMTNEGVLFYNIGVGGSIHWNPNIKDIPPHIALGHEMYHAFDSIRGLLDLRHVKGDNYEFVPVSEYRAVYFENTLRKAAGVKYRTHYGQTQTGPGVLDEQGHPILIPSPCLAPHEHENIWVPESIGNAKKSSLERLLEQLNQLQLAF